ncbi:Pol protein [Phytophthora palmivora]|uniref:Pol protein n=1 Tax=Phytophthora palmivora TaxID=4796 RepID=A0A2P4YNN0_9STRA|nr:Pol protein [Phytophthora palmivora]
MELLEWREVTSGVPSRMLSPLDVRALTDTVEDMKPEDAEGDSLMSSYEAGLLGSECVERLKKAGVRVTRSPASSSLGDPELKRPQHLPSRPASIPSMGSLMSYGTSAQDSRSTAIPSEVSGTRSASPMPSSGYGSTLFGPTASGSEESNLSGPVESQSCRLLHHSGLWEEQRRFTYRTLETIVSERDPRFTGALWDTLFQLVGTKLTMSTADHPQTDGQTERVNRVLEDTLRSICAEAPRSWSEQLPMVEFALNNPAIQTRAQKNGSDGVPSDPLDHPSDRQSRGGSNKSSHVWGFPGRVEHDAHDARLAVPNGV